jgi:hypothetical protein
MRRDGDASLDRPPVNSDVRLLSDSDHRQACRRHHHGPTPASTSIMSSREKKKVDRTTRCAAHASDANAHRSERSLDVDERAHDGAAGSQRNTRALPSRRLNVGHVCRNATDPMMLHRARPGRVVQLCSVFS